jgi:hypothetical protein
VQNENLCIYDDDGDDFYLKGLQREGVTKSIPTQKCRPAKGISKRVNIHNKRYRYDNLTGDLLQDLMIYKYTCMHVYPNQYLY